MSCPRTEVRTDADIDAGAGAGAGVLTLDGLGAGLLGALVTAERTGEIVRRIVGSSDIAVGPLGVGPAGLAAATGRGRLGPVRATVVSDHPRRLLVEVPVSLAVAVDLKVRTIRFLAHARVRLELLVEPKPPLTIEVRISEPKAEDVSVRVLAAGLARALLRRVGSVEGDLAAVVAAYVGELLVSEMACRYTRIDLHELIDRAWEQDLLGAPGQVTGEPSVTPSTSELT